MLRVSRAAAKARYTSRFDPPEVHANGGVRLGLRQRGVPREAERAVPDDEVAGDVAGTTFSPTVRAGPKPTRDVVVRPADVPEVCDEEAVDGRVEDVDPPASLASLSLLRRGHFSAAMGDGAYSPGWTGPAGFQTPPHPAPGYPGREVEQ